MKKDAEGDDGWRKQPEEEEANESIDDGDNEYSNLKGVLYV